MKLRTYVLSAALIVAMIAGMPARASLETLAPGTGGPWQTKDGPASRHPALQLSEKVIQRSLTYGDYQTLREQLLTRSAAEGGPGFLSLAAEAADAGVKPSSAGGGSSTPPANAFAIPSGDLDGDAKDDLFAVSVLTDDQLNLTAVKGTDRSVLWSRALPWNTYLLRADLRGDAVEELVFLSFTELGYGDGFYAYAGAWVIRQQFSVVGPSDGSDLWSQSIDGTLVVGLGYVPFAGIALIVGGTDLVGVVSSSENAGGLSDKGELFVGTFDFGYGLAWIAWEGAYAEGTRMVGRTWDGESGATLGEAKTIGVDGIPWVVPISDVSGDGLADVIKMDLPYAGTALISAASIDGESTYWSSTRGVQNPYLVAAALRSASASDLLLIDEWIDWDAWKFYSILTPIKGQTGAQMWDSRTFAWEWWFAGDTDGDLGTEIFAALPWNGDSRTLVTLSGATGTEIWSKKVTRSSNTSVLICTCPVDLNGKGVNDVLMADVKFSSSTGQLISGVLSALDGPTGGDLWSSQISSWSDLPYPVAGDVNGNGSQDLIRGKVTQTRIGDEVLSLEMLDGATARKAWGIDRAVEGYWGLSLFAGDLVGKGSADEIVLTYVQLDENWNLTGTVEVYNARGLVWTL